MNQTFELSRWWKLVIFHWMENRKRYLLAIPAIGGLLLAWFIFVILMDKHNPMDSLFQYASFYSGIYFIGCLYASMIFSDLASQPRGIGYLAIPASLFEKLLCSLLFAVFLFFFIYTALFYLVDIPMVHLANRIMEQHHSSHPINGFQLAQAKVYNAFTGAGGPPPDQDFHLFLLAYFPIQSAFVLGSVYFSRYSFIKTTAAVLLLIFGYMIFEIRILGSTLPAGWNTDLYMEWRHDQEGFLSHIVSLSDWASTSIGILFKISFPIFFWLITYFRLKEKEV